MKSGPISQKERMVVLRSLAVLFEAGIPLTQSFELVADSSEAPQVGESCRAIAGALYQGYSLPHAARTQRDLFGPVSVRLLEVGVKTGALVQVLRELAELEERAHRLRAQVTSSVSYPLLVFALCLLAAVILPPLVFGGVLEGLALEGGEVPTLTRLLMLTSEVLGSPWFLGLVALGVAGVTWWLKDFDRRDAVLKQGVIQLMRFQATRRLLMVAGTVRFAHLLSVCEVAGLGLHESLPLAAAATGNPVLAMAVNVARSHLIDGGELVDGLATCDLFDALFLSTLQVGLESGTLARSLGKVADMLEEQLQATITTFLAMLEPIMFALIGVIVGLSVIALLLPMVRLLESL